MQVPEMRHNDESNLLAFLNVFFFSIRISEIEWALRMIFGMPEFEEFRKSVRESFAKLLG